MDKKYELREKWKRIYKELSPSEKVKMISEDTGKNMLTVLDYLLRLNDPSINAETSPLKGDLLEDKFHVTDNWLKFMKKDSTSEIIEKINNKTRL